MPSSKQESATLRAHQHPHCVECLTRLTGPEIYTVTRLRDNRILAWDIDLAGRIPSSANPRSTSSELMRSSRGIGPTGVIRYSAWARIRRCSGTGTILAKDQC